MNNTQIADESTQTMDIEVARIGLNDAFAMASTKLPDSLIESDYLVAGHSVRARIAGEGLATDIDKAFQHLRVTTDATPELTIEIWDDAEVGPMDWETWPEVPNFYSDFRGNVSSSDDSRFVLNQRASSIMLLDRIENRIVGCVRGQKALFQDERARPFHVLLMVWLDDRDKQFIHSGLVEQNSVGLLIAGRSGAGKTTSSIACFLGGFSYLSDDNVVLEAAKDGNFIGHSLYATCLLDQVERFPSLVRLANAPNSGSETKAVVYLAEHDGGQFSSNTRLAALVMPKIVDQPDTAYHRARPMEAMIALAPSSLWLLPKSRSLQILGDMATKVPAYWLELGPDILQIAPTLERLTEDLKMSQL